ncbi:hypothetical protein KVV02_005911, partial [Mortierella alpina]
KHALAEYLRSQGWTVIKAEFEADVRIAQDCGDQDIVVSSDSDMIAYSSVRTVDVKGFGSKTNLSIIKSINDAEDIRSMMNEYLNSTHVINLNTTDIDFEIPQQVFVYMVQTPSALPPLNVNGYDALRPQYSDLEAQYAALRDSQQEASKQQRSYSTVPANPIRVSPEQARPYKQLYRKPYRPRRATEEESSSDIDDDDEDDEEVAPRPGATLPNRPSSVTPPNYMVASADAPDLTSASTSTAHGDTTAQRPRIVTAICELTRIWNIIKRLAQRALLYLFSVDLLPTNHSESHLCEVEAR